VSEKARHETGFFLWPILIADVFAILQSTIYSAHVRIALHQVTFMSGSPCHRRPAMNRIDEAAPAVLHIEYRCPPMLRAMLVLGIFALLVMHEARAGENHVDVAGKGPDVVLIPGLASSGASLQSIADHLSRCYRTHTFTLAGFAGQPANEGPQIDAWEKSLSDYIAKLPAHKAIIIGHSLGGILAMKLAIDHAAQVDKLVILDSLPYLSAGMVPGATVDSMRGQAEGMRKMIVATSDSAFRAGQQQALATMTKQPDKVPAMVEWSMTSDRAVVASAYYEMLTTDLRDSVAKIQTPMLVLVPHDATVQPDAAAASAVYREQYEKAPHAQIMVIENSRHFLTFDQPAETNAALDTLIRKCPK
jgi:pimeloyl-ACP methyl ester carboxylesterase